MISEKIKTTILLSLKWIFICVLIGFFSGSASAFLLVALEWAAEYRGQNNWIIWLLPIGGLLIGLSYHYYGSTAVRGNNLLLEEYETPKKKIPEWENDRRQEGKWKDVKYLDGVQLVHWLKDHPAIAARYARNVLRTAPQEGALSTDEYWEEFSTQFKPALNEKLVIAGRQNEADELIAKFCGPADSFMLGAETSEEVIAFAVAAIRLAAPIVRDSLESKTLIVRTQTAARFFAMNTGLVFIAMGDAESLVGALGKKCPTPPSCRATGCSSLLKRKCRCTLPCISAPVVTISV